jgi:hypothetical protein
VKAKAGRSAITVKLLPGKLRKKASRRLHEKATKKTSPKEAIAKKTATKSVRSKKATK